MVKVMKDYRDYAVNPNTKVLATGATDMLSTFVSMVNQKGYQTIRIDRNTSPRDYITRQLQDTKFYETGHT